jgi:hypothetical protein
LSYQRIYPMLNLQEYKLSKSLWSFKTIVMDHSLLVLVLFMFFL